MRSLGCTVNKYDCCSEEKSTALCEGGTTRGEDSRIKREAEMEVMLPQAGGYLGPPQSGRGKE